MPSVPGLLLCNLFAATWICRDIEFIKENLQSYRIKYHLHQGSFCGPFLLSKPFWVDGGSCVLEGDSPGDQGGGFDTWQHNDFCYSYLYFCVDHLYFTSQITKKYSIVLCYLNAINVIQWKIRDTFLWISTRMVNSGKVSWQQDAMRIFWYQSL